MRLRFPVLALVIVLLCRAPLGGQPNRKPEGPPPPVLGHRQPAQDPALPLPSDRTPQQQKLAEQIEKLGAFVDDIPHLADPKTPIGFSIRVDARRNRDEILGKLFPLLKQLAQVENLEIDSLEFTEATLQLLGEHLRDLKPLRTLTLGYRKIPANAEATLRKLLPRLIDGRGEPAIPGEVNRGITLTRLPAFAEAFPRPIDPQADELRRLQIEQYNLAIEGYQQTYARFISGRNGPEELSARERQILTAALALCETPQDRVFWHERAVEAATENLKLIEAMHQAGFWRGSTLAVIDAKFALTQARIELMRARQATGTRP